MREEIKDKAARSSCDTGTTEENADESPEK